MAENNQVTTFNSDPAANAPDAAAVDKGKGKAVDPSVTQEMSMDEDESEESENEEMVSAPIGTGKCYDTDLFKPGS